MYAFGSRAAEVVRRARGREGAPEAPGSDVDLGVQPRKDRRLTSREKADLTLVRLAGYRNRMVHFYHEVSRAELYELCTEGPTDREGLLSALLA